MIGLAIYACLGAITAAVLIPWAYRDYTKGEYDDDIPPQAYAWLFDRQGGLAILTVWVMIGWPYAAYEALASYFADDEDGD